jgi:hypothetical protein
MIVRNAREPRGVRACRWCIECAGAGAWRVSAWTGDQRRWRLDRRDLEKFVLPSTNSTKRLNVRFVAKGSVEIRHTRYRPARYYPPRYLDTTQIPIDTTGSSSTSRVQCSTRPSRQGFKVTFSLSPIAGRTICRRSRGGRTQSAFPDELHSSRSSSNPLVTLHYAHPLPTSPSYHTLIGTLPPSTNYTALRRTKTRS